MIARVHEEDRYTEQLVMRNMAVRRVHDVVAQAERNFTLPGLPFKWDQAADSLAHRLHKSLQRTFPAAVLLENLRAV